VNLSKLERLGLEVAAERLLCGNRGLGRMLAEMLAANGRPVSVDRLVQARVSEHAQGGARSVSVRICHLRSHLNDVGLADVIETHRGLGYAIPEPDRERVLQALLEAA
jgi:DNA-binding response OmpR family regulator